MRKLIVGNWKMNGTTADLAEIGAIAQMAARYPSADSALCLPATLISRAGAEFTEYHFGGQDCHMAASGPHTGCVSSMMLKDAGASLTILGHSERRAAGEGDGVDGAAVVREAADEVRGLVGDVPHHQRVVETAGDG